MNLTLKQKIGQMLIIRIFGKALTDDYKEIVKKYKIGGVILYSSNYDSYDEMLNLINEIKRYNKENNIPPMFVSIDEEGGRVNRFPKDIKSTPSAKKIKNNHEVVRKIGNNTSKLLFKSGINMNFAPVLDIQKFEDNHSIGNRCFGANKDEVIENALPMMKAIQKEKIISVIKHFPGHGLVKTDSHHFLPRVSKKLREIYDEDLLPFYKAIDEGADAVLLGHIILNKIDFFNPVSLSKKAIKRLLRCRYDGLIITDDIKMRSVRYRYGYKKALYKAINAGCDVILIGGSYSDVEYAINYVVKNAKPDTFECIEDSLVRISKIKEKYNINNDLVKGIDIKRYNKEIENILKRLKD